MKPTSRLPGFTLVELLVVIAIIGVLVAMAIPAVQASRELGRRAICQANMSQILLAVQSYDNAFEVLPAGVVNPDGPIRNEAQGLHQGWLIQTLPHLEEGAAFRLVDLSKSVYDPANEQARAVWPHVFICPSEPNDVPGTCNYAACHHDVEAPIAADNHGVMFLNSAVARIDIPDGAAYTIFVAEKRVWPGDLGWMSGTRATLRNTGLTPNLIGPTTPLEERGVGVSVDGEEPTKRDENAEAALLYVGGFGSAHVDGAFVGFGDLSVRYMTDEIDATLWHRLGNRADGMSVSLGRETD